MAHDILAMPVKVAVEADNHQDTTVCGQLELYEECCKALKAVQHYTANVAKNDYVRKVYACEFYSRYAELVHSAELDLLRTNLGLPRERGVGKESLVTRALIQEQWGKGAQEQSYYVNKIHNLKEAGKRWALVKPFHRLGQTHVQDIHILFSDHTFDCFGRPTRW